jgi:hypothetical protein
VQIEHHTLPQGGVGLDQRRDPPRQSLAYSAAKPLEFRQTHSRRPGFRSKFTRQHDELAGEAYGLKVILESSMIQLKTIRAIHAA